MTTIANNVAAKLAVAVVATAMILVAFAPSAKAQTTDELQKMINDLLAQVAQLQGQVGQGATGVASGVCPYTWTRDLTSGSNGADVMKLQQFLNADPDTRVAAEGAGSVGSETEFFGPATAAAVSKFQVKYRSEVLSPSGLVNPTGYFGPSSRTKANGMCTSASTGDDTTGDDTTGDDDDSSTTLSGEASLDSYEADDADDDSLNEGDDDAPVAIFTAQFEDGDASISRLDVSFVGVTGAQPWQAFDTVQLWVDGDMVAEEDASSKGDYLGDEDNGIIRFSGLDIVAMDGEDVEITVAVNVQNGLDTEELDSWTVTTESMRFFDADGVATTDDGGTSGIVDDESAVFTIDEAGSDDGADIKRNSNDPDASTLKVDDGTSKEKYDVFMFDIEVDEDSSDLEVGDAYATVTVSNPAGAAAITAEDVISRVYMTIDGEEVKGDADAAFDDTIASGTSQEVVFTFDFDGLELAADDTYEVVVAIEFKGQNNEANYENNVTVEVAVDGDLWDVDGPDMNDVLSGSRTSEIHTLATVVPDISGITKTTTADDPNDSGLISFEFTVGAEDDDIVGFDINDVDHTVTGPNTSIASVELVKTGGDATETSTGVWTIFEGDDATFALNAVFTTATTGDNGVYYVRLDSVAGVDVDQTSTGMNLSN